MLFQQKSVVVSGEVDNFPAIVKVDDFDDVTHCITFSFYLSLYMWVLPSIFI
ncbi:hypothetical protein HanRHA438_Chr03g0117901 [Helianthus annuus]|nr:hypothetical protein HanRHA438_Chr03g0117901 [Helianthus annuus]